MKIVTKEYIFSLKGGWQKLNQNLKGNEIW